MPCKCGLEVGSSVSVVVVHLSQILDELGLRLTIATHPIFVSLTISIVVLAVDVILID